MKTKKSAYLIPKHSCVVCTFDISLLPIKLNLPMVCKPLDWSSNCPPGQKARSQCDLSGGYLSEPTKQMYARYRLLSSADIYHFYMDFEDNAETLCRAMNKQQSQAFQINSDWLNYIEEHYDSLVSYGYLMPKFVVHLNMIEVSSLLRQFYMKDEVINKQ